MKILMQDQSSRVLCDILLTVGRSVALEVDPTFAITGVRNPLLLDEWRELAPNAKRDRPATLRALLEEIMPGMRARDIERQIAAGLPNMGPAGLYLGVVALHPSRGSVIARHAAMSFHRINEAGALMLVLRDVTALTDVQHALGEAQLTLDASLAVLRAPSPALRAYLSSALTSISAIRATLKLPARDQEAVRDKLARLHAAVNILAHEAEQLQLTPVQDTCQALLNRLDTLLAGEQVSGDSLLPLAGMVDRIAGSAGTLWRVEEQRYLEPTAATGTPRSKRKADWNFASERRWSSFLRHRGEELGVLVALQMEGTTKVPKQLRTGIDELLQHMLRNAVEHGIETPEDRLAASKPATGNVSVRFEARDGATLRMTVRDDGRGRGLGLSFLRKSVARLGGQISVAAKPDEYTQFVIDLPHAMSAEMPAQPAAQ